MGVQTEIKDMSKIMTNKVLEKLATDFKDKKTLFILDIINVPGSDFILSAKTFKILLIIKCIKF